VFGSPIALGPVLLNGPRISVNESSILACLFLIAADICFLGVIKSYSCSLIEKFIANAEDPQEDSTIFDSSEAE
jgi:hypothetical protein